MILARTFFLLLFFFCTSGCDYLIRTISDPVALTEEMKKDCNDRRNEYKGKSEAEINQEVGQYYSASLSGCQNQISLECFDANHADKNECIDFCTKKYEDEAKKLATYLIALRVHCP